MGQNKNLKGDKIRGKHLSQKIKYSFLKILTGSDLYKRRLPFMAAESVNPGPVVWLTGCIHGDEVSGIVIIHEIFKKIRKEPLRKGSLYAFPLMNPIGFETASRNITMTKEDLNRSFPGNKNGSLAERMAEKIFTTIIETKPTLVLDLHSDWIKSIPYTLIDSEQGIGKTDAYQKTALFGKKTGFLVVLDTEELKRTLSYSLIQHHIPALTIELGESYIVSERNVEYGVKSVYNILAGLRMVEPEEKTFCYQLTESYKERILKYSHHPVSSTSGIIRFFARPGDYVQKKQTVAKIYNSFGKLQETITALDNGIVLGHSDSSVAFPGKPVMAFGIM